MNVSDVRFISFDTETTGVNPATDALVEIAALAFDEDFDQRSFESLIKPHIPIPYFATQIHGITDEMVENAPSAETVLDQFSDFLASNTVPRIMIAHNAAFDLGFMHRYATEEQRANKSQTPELVLDSCMLAKALLDNLKTHRLESLASHFNVVNERAHRAMADVKTLRHVFMELLGIAADKFAASGKGLTVMDLIEACGGYFLYAPFDSKIKRKPFQLSPRISELEKLCGSDEKVGISYLSEGHEEFRYITPISVRIKGLKVFIEAHCHRDNITKTFRVDKIRSVKIDRLL